MPPRQSWTTLILGIAILACPAVQADGDWQWTLEPYLMASNIDGTAGIGRVTGAEVSMDTGDILDKLEIGAMIRGEALHKSGWGVMMDYAFMRLGDDLSLPRGGIVDATLRQGVFEAMVFRRHAHEDGYFDVYGGIRWWDNDVDVKVDPAVLPGSRTASIDEDWIDPVIGGRYFYPTSERWTLMLQGDIGGFGFGSDFSYSLAAGAIYQLSDSMRLDLKLKGLWVDYEDGTRGRPGYFRYDTVTYGPVIGLAFDF